MPDVLDLIDGLDLAVGRVGGALAGEELEAARDAANAVRERRGFLGGTLVLALAGGTGSGKSSLLNALAGEWVASVSPVRPHTDRPLAWIPADAEPGLRRLLDRLGIEDRTEQDRLAGVALIDLVDVDSVEVAHRRTVEAMLPEVDGVIWVLDPVKYRDPALHQQFLTPLVGYQRQFLFVLNQIDRLGAEERDRVMDDLLTTLRRDGMTDPVVFPVAADPPHGPREGIDALRDYLAERLDAKRIALGKLVADIKGAARAVANSAAIWDGGSVGFEDRWLEVLDATVTVLTLGRTTRGVVEEALCGIEDFVSLLAAETGATFGRRLREAFPPEGIEQGLRSALEVAGSMTGSGGKRRRDRVPDLEQRRVAGLALGRELEKRIGDPLRHLLWERATLSASVAALGVDAARVEAGLRI